MFKLDFLKSRNAILICVAVVAIIIVGVLIFAKVNNGFSIPSILGKSDSQIGKDVVKYINDNQLSQTPATLVSVSEASGLIKVKIKIGTQEFDSYATKDGKLLFPQAINMAPAKPAAPAKTDTGTTPAQTASTIQKVAAPMLEAYIVSSCPYGLQMQRAFADAVKNIPALASNVVMRYIGSVSNGAIQSMHGTEEAQENLRQICIRDEQPTKYWNYVGCYMKKAAGTMANGMPIGDSTGCQSSTGVDAAKLSACVSDPKRGLADAQKDFTLSDKYNVSGSPTLILDGAQVSENSFGGRASDAVKSIVCAAFKTQPSFCSTKLNTAAAAASFSTTYSTGASAGSTSGAACAPAAQ